MLSFAWCLKFLISPALIWFYLNLSNFYFLYFSLNSVSPNLVFWAILILSESLLNLDLLNFPSCSVRILWISNYFYYNSFSYSSFSLYFCSSASLFLFLISIIWIAFFLTASIFFITRDFSFSRSLILFSKERAFSSAFFLAYLVSINLYCSRFFNFYKELS